MYQYIYIYPRYLTKEQAEARARRWKFFFWLVFSYCFGLFVHFFFEMNKEMAFPHVFKFSVYALVPTTLSWLLVRYWRYVFRAFVVFFAGWALLAVVRQLWHFTAA
jgi:hypothetical protein